MKLINRVLFGLAAIMMSGAVYAAAMSDFWENKVADHLFRGTAYTAPVTLYVGLSTAACGETGFGTEVTGGSYARVAVTSGTAAWNGTHGNTTGASSGTSGTISNAAVITFPAPTASWGVVTHFFIADAASAGNIAVCSALTAAKTINSGDAAPSFGAAALIFQVDN